MWDSLGWCPVGTLCVPVWKGEQRKGQCDCALHLMVRPRMALCWRMCESVGVALALQGCVSVMGWPPCVDLCASLSG